MIVTAFLDICERLKEIGTIGGYGWQSLGVQNVKLPNVKTPAIFTIGAEDMRLDVSNMALRESGDLLVFVYERGHRGVGENRERDEARLFRAKSIVRALLGEVMRSDVLRLTSERVDVEEFFDMTDTLLTGYKLRLRVESKISECLI